jgi:plastocyanin
MNKTLSIVIIVLVIIAGWFMYKHYSGTTPVTSTNNTTTTTDNTNTMPPGTTMEDGTVPSTSSTSPTTTNTKVKEFTLSAGNYFFTPKTLTVNKGDTVKITVNNSGGFHDLKIDEFKVATPRLSGGQSATITFVADKTGSFQYYCSVGDHRAMGMWGTITVN